MKFFAAPRVFRMIIASVFTLVTPAVGTVAAQSLQNGQIPPAPKYPATARGTQIDELSGVRIADPYRWLENVSSPDVRSWVVAQNGTTEEYLAQLPRRREVQELVSRNWTFRLTGAPIGAGERLIYFENPGGDNQPTLYVQDKAAIPPRVLIDPNAFSRDGLIAIVAQSASADGRYLAYAVSTQGSAWRTIRVRDVRTSQDLGEELQGIKESPLTWTRDERGFFYVRTEPAKPTRGDAPAGSLAPDGRQRIFYHRVGHAQTDDELVFEESRHPEWRLRPTVSEDGQYLVIEARVGEEHQNRVYLIDLDNPKHPNLGEPLVKLFDAGDAVYEFVANQGPVFFMRTTKNAPHGRLVAVDINAPDEDHWTTVVRETYDPLVGARKVDDRIVAHRLHDVHSVLELYTLTGAARGTIPLPGVGTVTELNARSEYRELYFQYSSFLQQPVVFRYDLEMRATTPFRAPPADTALAPYETTQLYYTSKDGTRVPMFITARRGITLDGTHPALLSGTGAFAESALPDSRPRWSHGSS